MILASMDVSDVTEKKLNRWRMKATKGGNASCLAATESIEEHDKLHVRMRSCAHCTEIIRASHCSQFIEFNTSHLSVRRDEVSDGQWDVD